MAQKNGVLETLPIRSVPDIERFWPSLENCGILLHMGNKDARRREIKKPKKKEPPKHVVNQPVSRVVYNPPAPNPPTPKP
jgi:hypothetical protein